MSRLTLRIATFLRDATHDLHEVLAPLLGESRDRQPHELAVVRRRQAEVGLLDGALDVLDRAWIERLDDEQPRLGAEIDARLLSGVGVP